MEAESAAVSVEVTGLPIPAENAPAETQPEILVIENHIEHTPEGNTKWQEEIETILRQSAENQQNQILLVVQTIQGFRETMDKVLDCLLNVELKLQSIQNPQPVQQQAEELPAPVPVENPAEIIPAENPESPQQSRKRRQRI